MFDDRQTPFDEGSPVFDRRNSPLGEGGDDNDGDALDEPLDKRREPIEQRTNRAPFTRAGLVKLASTVVVLGLMLVVARTQFDAGRGDSSLDTLSANRGVPQKEFITAQQVREKQPEPEPSEPEQPEPDPEPQERSDAPRTADPEEVEEIEPVTNEEPSSEPKESSSASSGNTSEQQQQASAGTPSAQPSKDKVFERAEVAPRPRGGLKAIQQNVEYPESCRRAAQSGRVMVRFVVTAEGEVENARAVRGIGYGCDEAAVAAVEATSFSPGKQEGRPVNVRTTVPVVFRLGGR
jgi:TonB family protein